MQHTAVCQNSQSVTPKSTRDRVSFQWVSRSWYCCSLILEDICIFYLNLICVKKPKLAALCQLGLRISKLSECRIDSTANHSCPMMDQSVCAVTSIYRAAPLHLIALRLKPCQTSPCSQCSPSAGHSHGLITGAACYQKISVTEDIFCSIMIQWNLELLPSCERQAYGEMVCICASVNQSQVPKWLLLFCSQLRLTKDWYLFLVRGSFPRNVCVHVCVSVYALVSARTSVYVHAS